MEIDELERTIRKEESISLSEAFPALMRKVYLWMTLALAISGVTAYGVANSPALLQAIYSNRLVFFGIIIAELVMVWKIAGSVWKENRSLTTTTLMFVIFSALNGATLAYIFAMFSTTAIVKTFLVSTATFAATAAFGYFTRRDLTKLGGILLMALVGLIIAGLVNMFIASSTMDLVVSALGVLIFVGLTAWDSQRIKVQLAMAPDLSESSQKIALAGALSLYLDFINLFLYLLRFFGNSDN